MPFKSAEQRREYARKYYSTPEQKEKKKIYDHSRYKVTANKYKESRSKHSYPHRFLFNGVWQCAKCGSTSDLVIHHEDSNHNNNELSNLLCLCVSCHSKHHIRSRSRDKNGRLI